MLLVGTTTSSLQGHRKNVVALTKGTKDTKICAARQSAAVRSDIYQLPFTQCSQGLVDGVGWVDQRFSCHLHT